ncbi:tetraspanin [Artomyces pyxidatus]|uniref:Tetraspanin n=1 Tax=Artomyces pyxidatus TaxID=48021 RepID=A0ACB8SMG1_9AGAM|nr:tetraspanin [Artomyces pyxidatus]
MPNYLLGAYGFFTLCLLAASIISIVFSFVWRKQDLILNMVFSHADLNAGLALGICLLITTFLAVGAIVQRNHVTIGLVVLNWALIGDALATLVVGSFVWFYTLRERAEFHTTYAELQPSGRIAIQDMYSCCGYFNATDLVEFGGKFCTDAAFANSLNTTVSDNFCVTPVTKDADVSLNDVFTSVYGFMAVVIALFLTSLCVIKTRQEVERFKKIDAKRGGRGFV